MYYKDGEVHTASRGGEHYDYSTEHIRTDERLIKFFETNPTIILDGELFKRFKSLQQISGAARMEKNAYDCDWLEYWVYDCYILDKPEASALDRITKLGEELPAPLYSGIDEDDREIVVRLLEPKIVSGWDGMQKLHDQYVAEGFEGLVIRNPEKPYKPGGRTNDMIKIKHYQSSEFLVTGYELGLRGSEDMTFICETEDGIVFKAMPVGDREVKAEYVENFEEKYKGHMAECTYFNLSDDGVPTQPKLRTFRFDLE